MSIYFAKMRSGAQWVAGDPNNLLRAHFTLPKTSGPVTRARLFISGLGYYKAWINGDKADNHELGSFTTFEERVLYDIVDVTQQVHGEGAVNTIGVQLGHGWYAQPSVNVGPRQLLTMIKVTCQDGNTYVFASAAPGSSGRTAPWDAASASTSTTRSRLAVGTPVPAGREGTTGTPLPFESAPGPVTSDDIYLGEAYDARLLPDGWAGSPEPSTEVPSGEGYQPAVLSAGQVGAMAARQVQIYRDNSYSPRYISEPYDGVYVADMEQNMAGICTIRVQGQAGQTVHMQHAEIMNTDGTIHDVYRNAPMWANYTLKGSPGWEVYTPQFTYFGFRYVQITGMLVPPQPEDIVCHFIHSDTSRGSASAFESSSSMLNAIQQATRFASLSNQMDVFSDCPQRERRQWLGDMQLSCETVLHNFDVGAQYTKGIMDIADGQRHYEANFGGNGSIADCVPWYKHGRLPADPAWSVAFPLITRWVSRWFDDEDLVSEHYEGIKKYVDFEVNQAQGYKAKGGNGIDLPSTYGDWCPPGHGCPNKYEDLTSFYFIEGVDVVAQFAGVLGKDEDQAHYSQLAATLRQQYKSTYAIPNSAAANGGVQLYGKGDQFSQMLAVASGVVTGADADALVDWVIANITSDSARVPYHIEGGIVFVKLLWPLLSARGATDLALGLQTNQTGPSYGEMINQTATTLWESWDMDEFNGGASRNHVSSSVHSHADKMLAPNWARSSKPRVANVFPSFLRARCYSNFYAAFSSCSPADHVRRAGLVVLQQPGRHPEARGSLRLVHHPHQARPQQDLGLRAGAAGHSGGPGGDARAAGGAGSLRGRPRARQPDPPVPGPGREDQPGPAILRRGLRELRHPERPLRLLRGRLQLRRELERVGGARAVRGQERVHGQGRGLRVRGPVLRRGQAAVHPAGG